AHLTCPLHNGTMFPRACLLVLTTATLSLSASKPGILAVFAHPDDETTVSPLLAKYAAAGHPVRLVTITSGQQGTGPFTRLSADPLGAARKHHPRCAAKHTATPPPTFLQYQDQGISHPEVRDKFAPRLRRIIAETRPDVVITFGPDGATGHPDHRAASSI